MTKVSSPTATVPYTNFNTQNASERPSASAGDNFGVEGNTTQKKQLPAISAQNAAAAAKSPAPYSLSAPMLGVLVGTDPEVLRRWQDVTMWIPFPTLARNLQGIGMALVDRVGVAATSDPNTALMKSQAVLAVLKPHSEFVFAPGIGSGIANLERGVPRSNSVQSTVGSLHVSQRCRVYADWRPQGTIELSDVARNANVFGGVGGLLVQGSLTIPTLRATDSAAALAYYGAKTVESGATVALSNKIDLVAIVYEFKPNYAAEYVFQGRMGERTGGGGLFVERHPFPHVFFPTDANTGGALILGKELGNGEFDFTAFSIPFGTALQVEPDVIHGDSFFVGQYGIILAQEESDTVLFRRDDNLGILHDVKLV